MPAVFIIFIIVFAAVFIFSIGKGVAEWADNNAQPVLTESVRITAMRQETSRRHHSSHNRGGCHSTITRYYVTFELPSGNRREFSIDGEEYGMLAEGDEGTLTYQGTRYQGFVRHRMRAVVSIQE